MTTPYTIFRCGIDTWPFLLIKHVGISAKSQLHYLPATEISAQLVFFSLIWWEIRRFSAMSRIFISPVSKTFRVWVPLFSYYVVVAEIKFTVCIFYYTVYLFTLWSWNWNFHVCLNWLSPQFGVSLSGIHFRERRKYILYAKEHQHEASGSCLFI